LWLEQLRSDNSETVFFPARLIDSESVPFDD
jgi:hypothetical protein